MTLRCKPGELCRINQGALRDRFITVTHLDDAIGPRGPTWFYEGPRLDAGGNYVVRSFYDCVLDPIRAPGIDRETVRDVINEYAPKLQREFVR